MNIFEVEFTKDPEASRRSLYSVFANKFPIIVKVVPNYMDTRQLLEVIKKSFKMNLIMQGKKQHITGVVKELYKNSSGDLGLMVFEITAMNGTLSYYLGFKDEQKKKEILDLLNTVDNFKAVSQSVIQNMQTKEKDPETKDLFDK